MIKIAGILSKKDKSVSELLIKMLRKLSDEKSGGYYIFHNGDLEHFNNFEEINVSKYNDAMSFGSYWVDENEKFKDEQVIIVDVGCFLIDGKIDNLMKALKRLRIPVVISDMIIEQSDCSFSSCGYLFKDFVLWRDRIGHRPLYKSETDDHFAFSSEKKALWEIGFSDNIKPVQPGDIIIIRNGHILSFNFKSSLENKVVTQNIDECVNNTKELLISSVEKLVTKEDAALLFSGGLDSCIIAQILLNLDVDVTLYCAGFRNSKDFLKAKKIGKLLNQQVEFVELTDDIIWDELENIVYHLESNDTVTAEIATPFYFAAKSAKDRGFNNIFSGQGADELFAGYSRYEKILREGGYTGLQDALYQDVINIWQKNLERDVKVCRAFKVELKIPYLTKSVVKYCLQIPPEYKLKKNNDGFVRKWILKEIGKQLGLPQEILNQQKTAVQYGSGSTKCYRRLAKRLMNELDIDQNKVHDLDFRSGNELLMNYFAYKAGFPEKEIKNLEWLRTL